MAISGSMTAAEWSATFEPMDKWGPLEAWCADQGRHPGEFMFMGAYRRLPDGLRCYGYKDIETRGYVWLTPAGTIHQ